MRYCSVPSIGNLRNWFEKNFNEPCRIHDKLYDMKVGKFKADFMLAVYMKRKVATTLAAITATSLRWSIKHSSISLKPCHNPTSCVRCWTRCSYPIWQQQKASSPKPSVRAFKSRLTTKRFTPYVKKRLSILCY